MGKISAADKMRMQTSEGAAYATSSRTKSCKQKYEGAVGLLTMNFCMPPIMIMGIPIVEGEGTHTLPGLGMTMQ